MENYLEYIDAYFNQTLSLEEAKQFEQRIVEDKDFAQEVAFYLSAKKTLKQQVEREKKEWFKQLLLENNSISKVHQTGQVRKMWLYRIAAAAVIIICIFFGWYLFLSKSTSPQQMADKYIKENFETLPVTMGAGHDSIQNGLRLYNEQKYDSALQQFQTVIQKDTGNYLAKKYTGIVYLRLGNYDKALVYFQQLEKYSLYSNPATFYHALAIMKRNLPGDKQKARQLLQQVVQNDLEGKETAQQWLKKL